MGERALYSDLNYASGRSAGGSCRLLCTSDATVAINLPRPSDWELIPAWLQTNAWNSAQRWEDLAGRIRNKDAQSLIARARLLGIAASSTRDPVTASRAWEFTAAATGTARHRPRPPRVLDLSTLWAGPLCAHLLSLCGADVIKVESSRRPDGARLGNQSFYRLLNQGKRCVALDLAQHDGQRLLRELLTHADIVIESARPRGLQQMQIHADALLQSRPNLTWISITGYGRGDPEGQWVAFGDDAGVAAGLSAVMRAATGDYQFAGDAVADPITGIHAALCAWRSWLAGGSRLISLPLAQVTAAALLDALHRNGKPQLIQSFARWWRQALSHDPHQGIVERRSAAPVGGVGDDTAAVLAELGIAC
jgi:hypothetical protein